MTARVQISVHVDPTAEIRARQIAFIRFEQAAAYIDEGAVHWLPDYFEHFFDEIRSMHAIASLGPRKAQLKRDLEAITGAAQTLKQALSVTSPAGYCFAQYGAFSPGFPGDLDDVLRRCEAVKQWPQFTKPTLRGTGRILPLNNMTGPTCCALTIAEGWRSIHGDLPSRNSVRANKAAESLWSATRHNARTFGDKTHTKWRHYFDQAEKIDTNSPFRAERRRILTILFERQTWCNNKSSRNAEMM